MAGAGLRWRARGAGYDLAKRLIDVAGAVSLLAVALPLMSAVALAVALDRRGPVLFRQRRLGFRGRIFICYKFRTMVAAREGLAGPLPAHHPRPDAEQKPKLDPRVTRVGRFLRQTSLDETPQLWNVLRGDMSLIGPRPIVEPELSLYGPYGRRLLTVKPGLSGLWQVSGRSDTTYDERVALDMRYIEDRCLSLDLRLIARTALVVLRQRGAY